MSAADYNTAAVLDYASPGGQVIKAVVRANHAVERADRASLRRQRARPPSPRPAHVFDAIERALGGEPR